MTALFSSQEHLEKLVEALSTRPVLGMCGAGISAPLGYPTWQGLIKQLLDYYEARYSTPLAEGLRFVVDAQRASIPNIAQFIKSRMNLDDYNDFLKNVFSPRAEVDLSYEYECMAHLPVRLWLTTNYDKCLGEALREKLRINITTPQTIPFDEILSQNNTLPQVVHLHGIATEPSSIILTEEDYTEYYHRRLQLSQSIGGLGPLTVLFVGYGLQDDEIQTCLERTKAILRSSAAMHYALLPKMPDQTPVELDLSTNHLLRMGVQPIFYQPLDKFHSGRQEVLLEILQRLRLPVPLPRVELSLRWKQVGVTHLQLRQYLRKLTEEAGLTSPLTLRHCSFEDKVVTIAVSSEADLELLKKNVSKVSYWEISPDRPLPPSLSQPEISASEEQILIEGDLTQLQVSKDLLESSSIINLKDFQATITSQVDSSKKKRQVTPTAQYSATSHAIALGLTEVPSAEVRQVLRPLVPPKLSFGLPDCFHSILDWRLDSPIIHAWIYQDETGKSSDTDKPVAITIIGTGLPHIQQKIESTAYTIAFALSERRAEIILTRGLIHLSCSDTKKTPPAPAGIFRNLVRAIFASGDQDEPTYIPADTQEALLILSALLRDLSKETGFVQVHSENYSNLRNYVAALRRHMMQGGTSEKPTIFQPKQSNRIVTFIPLPIYPYLEEPRLLLHLSGDLIDTPVFKSLIDTYYRNVITTMVAGVERRIEFWRHERDRDIAQVRWFKSLSQKEQDKIPDVITSRRILEEYAIDVITEEQRVTPRVYYLHSLPNYHIPKAEKELKKLETEHEPIAKLAKERYSFIWRKCLSKIFDCAIRQIPLSQDSAVNSLFERWCAQVDSVLRFEWTRLLERLSVEQSDVFKRITFFEVDFQQEKNIISIFPNVLIDTSRATVVIDRNRKTVAVNDVLDEANNVPAKNKDSVELKRNLQNILTSYQDVLSQRQEIRNLIYRNPEILKTFFDHIFSPNQTIFAFDELRKEVTVITKSATAAARFVRLHSLLAYNSAIECLAPEDELNPPPGKALILAVVQCLRSGYDPNETLKKLHKDPNYPIPPSISIPFNSALEGNKEMVEQFLENGRCPDVEEVQLTPAQEKARDIERSIEAALLSEKLLQAAANLEIEGETLNTAFLKVEEAFEGIYMAIFTNPTPSLLRIQRMLTGEPMVQ